MYKMGLIWFWKIQKFQIFFFLFDHVLYVPNDLTLVPKLYIPSLCSIQQNQTGCLSVPGIYPWLW